MDFCGTKQSHKTYMHTYMHTIIVTGKVGNTGKETYELEP